MPPVTPRTMWGVMVGAMFFALSLDLGFLRDFLFGQLVRGLLQDAPLRAVVPADPRLGELLGGELRRLHGAVRLELRARAPHQLLCAAGDQEDQTKLAVHPFGHALNHACDLS